MPTPQIDPQNFTFFDLADERDRAIKAIKAAPIEEKPASFESIRQLVLAQLDKTVTTGTHLAVLARTVTMPGHGSQLQITINGYDA